MLVTAATVEVALTAPVTTTPVSIFAEWTTAAVVAATAQSKSQAWLLSTGTQTIIANPGAGYSAILSTLSVLNQDSVSATVTVRINTGTVYPVYKVTLAAGDNLFYQKDRGFFVVDSSGNVKGLVSLPSGAAKDSTLQTIDTDLKTGIATLALESGGVLDRAQGYDRVRNLLAANQLLAALMTPAAGFVPMEVPSFLVG